MRQLVILSCSECKSRNYTTTKNKQRKSDRMELRKYCSVCRRHTIHKETK